MRIRVLDGYTLNPGDIGWEPLQDLGEIRVYERSSAEEVLPRADGAQALIVNKVPLDAYTLSRLSGVEYVGIAATGYDLIDLEQARQQGIAVTNVPDYSSPSVAQGTWALLMELTNRVGHHAQSVREGKWSNQQDFSYWEYPIHELWNKDLGIVGFGNTGRRTAAIALAMGMNVRVYTRTVPGGEEEFGVRFCSLEELIAESDVISLHCPLTEETEKMVNEKWLYNMRDTAYLINTSRGGVVEETALDKALRRGWIAGAGLDVMAKEPPEPDNPLFSAPNCFITAHVCWASRESRIRLMREIGENLRAFLRGKRRNRVV